MHVSGDVPQQADVLGLLKPSRLACSYSCCAGATSLIAAGNKEHDTTADHNRRWYTGREVAEAPTAAGPAGTTLTFLTSLQYCALVPLAQTWRPVLHMQTITVCRRSAWGKRGTC